MHVYNVLLSSGEYVEIYADSAEVAERDVEKSLWDKADYNTIVVIAEEV